MRDKKQGPRILLLDIETSPIIGYVWSIWEQNVGLNQINKDWHVLSWAAKWLDEKKVMYQDQRDAPKIENDKELLRGIWHLLDEADIVITQNGKAFDIKKLNARFVINRLKPPSSFKQIDTKLLAKKHFSFTSNKLEYMADKLCTKYKKLKHHKFEGFELWKQCLAGNIDAWNEMEKYNKHDVLALEELYNKLSAWDTSINFSIYSSDLERKCSCGSKAFIKRGFFYTGAGKYQRYKCRKCGAETRSGNNQLSTAKRKSLRRGVIR